ncbi:MAG: DMT family transporter [Candidatus Omnitrophota bacterium]
MKIRTLKSDLLLTLAAIIWGFSFVAQRKGMEFVGPFTFTGVRFAIGALSLLPLMVFRRRKFPKDHASTHRQDRNILLKGGVILGLVLFFGISFQQNGLVYTTAGKAGFITGLYVLLVPLLGLFWKQRPSPYTWFAAIIATIGLYFLSINESFVMAWGDLLEVIGAFFWAGHVLVIGWLSPRTDAIKLSILQFTFSALLSLLVGVIFETTTIAGLRAALIPILYGGILSSGVAYTLQIVAQKDAPPSHASVILCMESLFAALGGWMILGETFTVRSIVGCALMLSGILLSQLQFFAPRSKLKTTPVLNEEMNT